MSEVTRVGTEKQGDPADRAGAEAAGFGKVSRRGLLAGAAVGAIGTTLLGRIARASGEGSGILESGGSGVSGWYLPRFRRVRDEFVRNFAERGEVGAAVSVTLLGVPVVDLWGGTADPTTGAPWERDTLVHVWSCTKGATALCAHMLASRGLLDLDARVADYWPEFGQNGKEATTVAQLMSHQAGVPAIRAPLPAGALFDWDFMTEALAAEAPFWAPGSRHGYHALTFGFLVGELVRRIDGRSLATFFREEVAEPYGIDFHMTLPASLDARVAPVIPADPPAPPFSSFLLAALTDPTSIAALVLFNNGGYLNPGVADTREAREAEIGATGGITTARGLAKLYATLLGRRRSQLVNDASFARMGRVNSAGLDQMGLIPSRFTLGYTKSMDGRRQPPGDQDTGILSEDAFGHSGFGGSIGFVDPGAGLSFGYVMNRQGPGTLLNPRGQSLIDATYRALGYREAGGSYVR
jgi:CubicO group peptidase (beta-lactamase class C family)